LSGRVTVFKYQIHL